MILYNFQKNLIIWEITQYKKEKKNIQIANEFSFFFFFFFFSKLISIGISSLSSKTRKNEVINDYNKFVCFPYWLPK